MESIALTLFGALIGWFLSWHQHRVSENANIISDHISDMQRFAELLREHWSCSFENVEPEQHKSEIARIKALHASIVSFYGEAQSRLGRDQFRDYQVLQLRLFKVGLGGDFESVCRKLNEEAAIDSQIIAWEIIQQLRKARRQQYGIGNAISLGWHKLVGG